MGRGRGFSPIEVQLIVENFDKTIAELEEILLKNGYKRSRKSINRKIEKLRDAAKVGLRSKDTIRRSYRQRNRDSKAAPTALEDSFSALKETFTEKGNTFSDMDGFGSVGFDEADWDDEDN